MVVPLDFGRLRDCQGWRDVNLPLSTQNNEAAKYFDAALTQYVSWFEQPQFNGLGGTCEKMLNADPTFIMGRVITYGLDILSTGKTTRLDPILKANIEQLCKECESSEIVNDREELHVQALRFFSEDQLMQAADVWEQILCYWPTDLLALKFAHDTYFFLGQAINCRDSIARVLPEWHKDMPLYGYLKGMHAFGLEETNLYRQAELAAREGLAINRHDCWSTHAQAHVYEMESRSKEGIEFLTETVNDWHPCGMLACHNYWHLALCYIEQGQFQDALGVFDSEVKHRVKSGAMLDLVDGASLLKRLELEGLDVGDRWEEIYELCRPHLDDHVLSFNDAHLLMSFLGAKKQDAVQQHARSLLDYVNENWALVCVNHEVTSNVGQHICQALIEFDNKQYAAAVSLLAPIRYDIVKIGGSHAQRDIFNQLLVHSCILANNADCHTLARALLNERKALRPHSKLTERLASKLLSCHISR